MKAGDDSATAMAEQGQQGMEKRVFVEQLREGDRVDDLFLVKSAKVGETRAGKPYLQLVVGDRSGEISGPIWERVEAIQQVCVVGRVVRLAALVQSYRDKLQLRIDDVGKIEQGMEESLFYPVASRKPEEMGEELQAIIGTVSNPHLRKLLNHFFKQEDFWQKLQQAPAAKAIHHAYRGGLLEHCLSMARIAGFLADHYAAIDRSLLLAGVLLHDVGKIAELSVTAGVVDYSDGGRLKGHLVIGSEMVAAAAAKIRDFPEGLLLQLQHLILSHHGKQEFGSPVVPMTVEALLLSFIDDLDAKMNIAEQLRRKIEGPAPVWSEYQRALERYLFLGALPKEEVQAEPVVDAVGRQPRLF